MNDVCRVGTVSDTSVINSRHVMRKVGDFVKFLRTIYSSEVTYLSSSVELLPVWSVCY